MAKEETPVVFKVGDRVTNLDGDREGTISRLGRYGESAQVKWDNSMQELVAVTDLKKEENAVLPPA
jgi:hypothetical protein